jgi:hypothetical protein
MYRAFAHSESYGTHYSKFPRQGTLDFEVTLGNMVRPCLKTNKQQQQQIKTPANYKDTTPPQINYCRTHPSNPQENFGNPVRYSYVSFHKSTMLVSQHSPPFSP